MIPTPLIFAATCDLAGKVRGKAFPADQLEKRLKRGVGWTPTNVQITCFDAIAETPFGALGDLLLVPDAAADVRVAFAEDDVERFMLGDILTLEGEPWALCARSILKAALDRLHRVAGVRLVAAFEHEFQIKGPPKIANEAYGRGGFEAERAFCETLTGALRAAGLRPDSIMKEYAPAQIEAVIEPEEGVRAADAAVIVRELTRATARRFGDVASFAPILDPNGVGNGVHIHMSFVDEDGRPVTHDPDGPCGMSALCGAFAAGVLAHIDGFLAALNR
jgi:glutamine synthetase